MRTTLLATCNVFTGLKPSLRERDGRQGAVDISIATSDSCLRVAEVTCTIEDRYQSAYKQNKTLATDITERYSGSATWLMELEHGWRAPGTTKKRHALASRIAKELQVLDGQGRTTATLETADWIRVNRGDSDTGSATVVSWHANVPNDGDSPYLDRLTEYLTTSDLIKRKKEKLTREAEALSLSRRHLYLLMAGTGADGGLLPASPSYMTWGHFASPAEITDLWLDGGTGEIYHWNDVAGWCFHRL